MQALTQASENALRALTFLAVNHGEGYRLAREIAHEVGIPAPFLSKILRTLSSRGLLESQRGRGGGFRLARRPGDVHLAEIVGALEDLGRARRCALGQEVCSDELACPLHDTWKRASEEWLERLRTTTLEDLTTFCRERPASSYPTSE